MSRLAALCAALCAAVALLAAPAPAAYTNFEVSQVHPVALTPSGDRLLVVNTPDAVLEVFAVDALTGQLTHQASVPVGLEPVSVAARSDAQAWVVNHLSDSVSVVNLLTGVVEATLPTGDEPLDVAFAGARGFVALGGDDALHAFTLADLAAPPAVVPLRGRKPRALASDGATVYAVVQFSGNQTTVVNANVIFGNSADLVGGRLSALGLEDIACDGAPPAYPPLPAGVTRNAALVDPPSGVPEVGLIVKWNDVDGEWQDETGTSWNDCLPLRVSDHDLFAVDAATLAVIEVDHLGTSLLDVSVRPGDGTVWVSNTDARNHVRFEHPAGVQGHIVDNRLSVVDPADGNAVTVIDLNTHIDRDSDPSANLAERLASISQPGQLVWNDDGSAGWLTGIGTRKLFRVDGACLSGACIFGADRSSPAAVEVGEGPTGVAYSSSHERLWVLNRFSNTIAVVDAASMTKLDEIPLHDPSPATVRDGRRFLYDAILGSGHGDAACSSCHIGGDRDDLAWDLGNPAGGFQPYSTANDNVRFVFPVGGSPLACPPEICAAHAGHDPQKGPMTTQTLRGMLEPLHWRGDRATFENFNQAFPGLMGTADIGPIDGEPAGIPAPDMALFRTFALGITYPPNPHRNLDDSLPNVDVLVRGAANPGNPTLGRDIFDNFATDAGQPCQSCHTHPFGAGGGTLGGVTPTEPTSAQAAALFNGDADQSPHSDLKIPHLRNMYDKQGPTFGAHGGTPPVSTTGFGFGHDGSLPDLNTFFTTNVFDVTPDQIRHVSAFTLHFPTGTRPAVGAQVTLPPGTPPTGDPADESRLATLLAVGDGASGMRHCELVVSAAAGDTLRRARLAAGMWTTDAAADPPMTTAELREAAASPLTFFCVPRDSGTRLGGDRDLDGALDLDDCADGDPQSWLVPSEATGLAIDGVAPTDLAWAGPSPFPGPSLRHEVVGGLLSDLRSTGLAAATGCLADDLGAPAWQDPAGDPLPGDGRYYLVRGRTGCGAGPAGPGRAALDALSCP